MYAYAIVVDKWQTLLPRLALRPPALQRRSDGAVTVRPAQPASEPRSASAARGLSPLENDGGFCMNSSFNSFNKYLCVKFQHHIKMRVSYWSFGPFVPKQPGITSWRRDREVPRRTGKFRFPPTWTRRTRGRRRRWAPHRWRSCSAAPGSPSPFETRTPST